VEPVFHVDERLERGEGDFAVVEDIPAALLVVDPTNLVEVVSLMGKGLDLWHRF